MSSRAAAVPGQRLNIAGAMATMIVATMLLSACAEMTTGPQPSESVLLPTPSPTPTPVPAPPGGGSIDDPNSYWVVVNKLRPLNPADHVPIDLVDVPVQYANAPQLRVAVSAAVVAMFAAITAETGMELQSQSAYRSYSLQTTGHNRRIKQLGQEAAELLNARPGHSEHQTGLAIDISSFPAECPLEACFAETAHGQWLADNAWRFGFTLRYPKGKTHITGYVYEPWHFRYVGVDLARALHERGETLEEHFDLPFAPSY